MKDPSAISGALSQVEVEELPDLATLSQPCLDKDTWPCEMFAFTSPKPAATPQPVAKPLLALS